MLKSLMLSMLLLPVATFAKGGSALDQTLKKYQTAKQISMKVVKTVKSELLGKETTHKGLIQMASGKFRWENEEPEKSLLLFDGKILLNVQYPPEDFGGPIQVAKTKIDEKSKKQILISSLLSPASTKSKFKVLDEKKTDQATEYKVSPEGSDLQIQSLTIKVEPKDNKIKEISYVDDVGNLTVLEFSDVKFLSKADPGLFKFKIPKDAQVTDL